MMQRTVKRAFDIALSGLLLLLLSPLLAIIAWKVKQKLGTPVFFRQERIGLHEKPFTLIKFRTMRDGTERDSERMTEFGQWLRASSVDELPELWNIFIGDMSFVGPRPLLPRYLPYYTEAEKRRHSMRPGLTGLAQVSGRNALGWDERLALDVDYVDRWSLKRDHEILWRTYMSVLKREGISAEGEATMQALDEHRKAARHG
jgi:lipopolysaccharide/colanic/teichoic acid biosynthesis glycosyltransferase